MTVKRPRIAVLGMHLESNAFAPVTTGADFRASCYLSGDEILAEAGKPSPAMPGEISGFVAEMNRAGAWEPVPILVTATEPGGPVEDGFFRETLTKMETRLSRALPVDAVYISNHGAMVSTRLFDPDGRLYRMVRDRVGPGVPVVATVDLHANISEEMVASTDAIVSYRTNPHVDQAERAAEAAGLLRGMIGGERLARVFIRLPIVAPTVTLLTARGPYADLIAAGERARGDDVPLVSVVAGFAFSDTPKNGLAVLTYGAAARAAEVALALARQAWEDRARFQARLTSLEDAIEAAVRAGNSPAGPAVCLADVADNPGGGGRGNTTDILEALLAARPGRVLMGLFVDAALANACHARGEGAVFEATFNEGASDEYAKRLRVPLRVLSLGDGRVTGRRGLYRGRAVNLGPSAAVEADGLTVAVVSRRVQCADPAFFESLGLDVGAYRTVVVKSRGHFRAGFDEYFGDAQILEVDAPGLTSPVLSRFPFRNLPRPVFPLDPKTRWTPPEGLEPIDPAR